MTIRKKETGYRRHFHPTPSASGSFASSLALIEAGACSPVIVAYTWQRRLWLKVLLDILDEFALLHLPEPLMSIFGAKCEWRPRDLPGV